MSKNVQIDIKLFCDILRFLREFQSLSYDDVKNNPELMQLYFTAEDLVKPLEKKLDKLVAHQYFTDYKTATGSEREKLRLQYLDFVGVSFDFRTDEEQPEEQPPENVVLDDMLNCDDVPEFPEEVGYY